MTTSPTPKWKPYAVLAAVFVLGAAAGGGAVFAIAQRRHAAMWADEGALRHRKVEALGRRLDLDASQKQQIQAILDKDKTDRDTLEDDMIEKCGQPLRNHDADVEAQIKAVLRPDQKAKFEQMLEHRKKRHGRGR